MSHVSAVTTHVLDTATGAPAAGVLVRLEHVSGSGAVSEIGRASTDQDGRASGLGPAQLKPGTYRLVFDTAGYAQAQQAGDDAEPAFFPEVTVTFVVGGLPRDYHVPLLFSPFGYSTYRGS
jgi:5-hydroxyisourate hydrolase